MKVNEENIGKVFKEVLNNYEVQPDPVVWQNVRQLTPASNPFTSLVAKLLYVVFAVVLVGASIYYLNDSKPQIAEVEDSTIVEKEISTPVEKEITTKVEEQIAPVAPEKVNEIAVVANNTSTRTPIQDGTSTTNEVNKEEVVSYALENITPIEETVNNDKGTIGSQGVVKEQNTANDKESVNQKGLESSENITDVSSFNPSFSEDVNICYGSETYLVVEDGHDYSWSTGEFTNKIRVSPKEDATYTVTVTSSNGQISEHEFSVAIDKSCTAVEVPNAFSPNDDMQNDVFLALGVGIENFKMTIMDRNYKLVFESNDINEGWDGTFNGDPLPTGVFVCIITYTDAKGNHQIKNKTITLVR